MEKMEKAAPKWHDEVAAILNREGAETDALDEAARRKRARIGLMLIWVKEKGKADDSIPHGQFGPWIDKRIKAFVRRTAGRWMAEGKSLLELLRWQNGQIVLFETPPHRLLMADAGDLKGVEKERQQKLIKLIEEQAHVAAVTQYKQVELRDDMIVGRKGQMKGSKGCTRAMRAAHQQKLAEADLEGRKALLLQLGDLCDDAADAKGVGDPECAEEFAEIFPKVENLFRFMQRVKEARK